MYGCSTQLLDPIQFGGRKFTGSSGDRRRYLGTPLDTTDQAIDYDMEDNRWNCFLEIQNSAITREGDGHSHLGPRGHSVNLLFADKNSGLIEAFLYNAKHVHDTTMRLHYQMIKEKRRRKLMKNFPHPGQCHTTQDWLPSWFVDVSRLSVYLPIIFKQCISLSRCL